MEDAFSPWQLATVLGPIIIAVVVIYAMMRKRRLTPVEKVERHHAIDEAYKDKDPRDDPPAPLR
jgi:hypothetical protein